MQAQQRHPFLFWWSSSCGLFFAICTSAAFAQSFSEPVVARMHMKFTVGEEVVNEIQKGELLTVLEEREDAYVISTLNGQRGVVEKVNAARMAESVEIYSELIEEHPEEGLYYTMRASAWWARGEEEKALADYDQAIALGYEDAHAFSSRGMFHAALGNYEEALADYNRSIEQGATDETPYINIAAVHMSRREYDLAIENYDRAAEINAQNSSVVQQRAVAKKLKGDLEAAIDDFNAVLEVDAENVSAWMGRGYVQFQLKDYEMAIADFGKVIELSPDSAHAYNNRGFNYQLQGKFAEALADYDSALELAPSFSLTLQNKSWLLATVNDDELRDGATAVELATRVCELAEYKNPGNLKALAAAFAEDGQFTKAVGWQEKAIDLIPDEDKPAQRAVLNQFAAEQPLRIGDYTKVD